MVNYNVEKRESHGNEYIKVFLARNSELATVKEKLEILQSVRRVNISNDNRDLTIYPKKTFAVDEVMIQVKNALNSYYSMCECHDLKIQSDVKEIRDSLAEGSNVRKCYDDALNKMKESKYDRNILDDIRLALEMYLKEVLGNDKPLEKQRSTLKEYYEKNDMSSELIGFYTQSLFNLCNFFNNHTKHGYNVKHEEIDGVIGAANLIMKSLLKRN